MARLYNFIFYLIYKLFIKLWKKDIPEMKALVLFSLWEAFYLLIPFGIVRYAIRRNIHLSKTTLAITLILIVICNVYLFMRNNRYLKIYRQFEKMPDLKKKYGPITMIAFFLIPILALIVFTRINRVMF
jgi:uncharacterized membrane protein YidH (DUF202 family)